MTGGFVNRKGLRTQRGFRLRTGLNFWVQTGFTLVEIERSVLQNVKGHMVAVP
jgi:hypothetical protein